MKNVLIGIAGEANSGKDTVASIINYIHKVGITKATYSNWLTHQQYYDILNLCKIIHFADPLKDCLSIMFGINRDYFDDRDKKDKEYYLLNERRFVDEKTFKGHYLEITIDVLKEYNLNEILYDTKTNIGIKLRTLMQYFGTDICRNQLDERVWIKATIDKAADIIYKHGICIIPDVRYADEAESISNLSFTGGVIRVKRDNCNKSNHSSEIIDFDCAYEIDNNGTKMQLFYKVIDAIKNLTKK